MKTFLVLYVPVIHHGYTKLIEKYGWVSCIYLLAQNFVEEMTKHVEIRALDQKTVQTLLSQFVPGVEIKILDQSEMAFIRNASGSRPRIVTADEEVTRLFTEKYLHDYEVSYERTFLRWDAAKVLSSQDVAYDRVTSSPDHQLYIRQAELQSEESSDWWRQVGAVLITPEGPFKGHNRHVPTEYTPYINGDPRDVIKAGTHSELSSALHAEIVVFAQALLHGQSTLGADLYTTVFPCPACAKLIAESGVKRLFYKTGHASLDGVGDLKRKKVEIVKVKME